MRFNGPIVTTGLIILAIAFTSGATLAASITEEFAGPYSAPLTGTIAEQGTAMLEQVQLPAVTDLTVQTDSYLTGGFESNLFLYDAGGSFIAASTPFGEPDLLTGIVGDSRLTTGSLPAGLYTLVITDFLLNQSLTATSLSDGFTVNFGNGSTFVDSNGNTRTGDFSINILYSTALEPATLVLAAPCLGLLVGMLLTRRGRGR